MSQETQSSRMKYIDKHAYFRCLELSVSESCNCPVCRSFSRAYLRHLFKADEVLALRFAVLHNLYFYNELMARIRQALDEGRFAEFRARYSGKLEQRV